MTVVKICRATDKQPMEFRFDSEMAAFGFYADAKDSYCEDDLTIEMENENGYQSKDK